MDESRANKALGSLTTDESTTDAINKIIESVKKEDVDVIMSELEVTDDEATAALRAAAKDNETNGEANSIEGQQLIAAALRILVTQSI